jgi:hypothetical protein
LYAREGNFDVEEQERNFVARVYLRRTWRGAEAALRLAERQAPTPDVGIAMRVRMLAELGRVAETAELLESTIKPQPWDVHADAGRYNRAGELVTDQLPTLSKKLAAFADLPRIESEMVAKDGVRSKLILAEIALGHRDAALALLDAWRREMEKRPANNRRAAGPFMMNLPRYYALLGKHEAAVDVLVEFMKVGRTLGYDLRDSTAFASIGENPRFLDLRRQAEEWTAIQPNPTDEPTVSPGKSP